MKYTHPITGLSYRNPGPQQLANLLRKGFVAVEEPPEPPAPTSPEEVHNWQLEEEMSDRGMLSAVNTAIDSLPAGKTRQKARARWNKKPTIRRNDPLIAALGQVLNLTSEQIDDIFTFASNRT